MHNLLFTYLVEVASENGSLLRKKKIMEGSKNDSLSA